MNAHLKYTFMFCVIIAKINIFYGQTDTSWNIEEWKKNNNRNWGNVNDSIKTKFDFFMESKSWGLAGDISTSVKSNSTFVSLRYFFAEGGGKNNLAWIFEISSGYDFHKTLKNNISIEFIHLKAFPLGIGFNAEHFYRQESVFFLSPLLRLDIGFIALEYSKRLPLSSKTTTWVFPNNFSIIIRPILFFEAYKGENYSQYWNNKNLRK